MLISLSKLSSPASSRSARALRGDPRVIHEHIQAAEPTGGKINDARAVVGNRYIPLNNLHFNLPLPRRFAQSLAFQGSPFVAGVVDDEIVLTARGKLERDPAANSAGRSGDEGDGVHCLLYSDALQTPLASAGLLPAQNQHGAGMGASLSSSPRSRNPL